MVASTVVRVVSEPTLMLVNDSTAVLPVVVVVIPRDTLPPVVEECEDCVEVAEEELESLLDL